MSTNIFTNAQMEGAIDRRFEQKYNYLVKLLSQMINTNTGSIDTNTADLLLKEDKSNKVTSLSAGSTDVQYPSAKLTYDQLAGKQSAGNELTALQALADTAGFVKKTGDGAYGIDTATYQASGNELTALQALADTAGFVKKTGDGTYSLETTTAAFKASNSSFTDNDTEQTFVDAFCDANSLVVVSITGSTPAGVWSVVSGAGSFTITSTSAESTDITFDYYIIKVG